MAGRWTPPSRTSPKSVPWAPWPETPAARASTTATAAAIVRALLAARTRPVVAISPSMVSVTGSGGLGVPEVRRKSRILQEHRSNRTRPSRPHGRNHLACHTSVAPFGRCAARTTPSRTRPIAASGWEPAGTADGSGSAIPAPGGTRGTRCRPSSATTSWWAGSTRSSHPPPRCSPTGRDVPLIERRCWWRRPIDGSGSTSTCGCATTGPCCSSPTDPPQCRER